MSMKPKSPRPLVSCLGVAVASLICANGAVAAERWAGRDLSEILADAIRPTDIRPEQAGGTQRLAAPNPQRDSTFSASTAEDEGEAKAEGEALPAASSSSTATTSKRPRNGGRPGGTSSSPTTAGGQGAPVPTTVSTYGPIPLSVAASGGNGAPGAPGAGTPGVATAPAANELSSLERAAAELRPFVEREAGHTFKGPVPVRIVSGAQFSSRLAQLNPLPRGQAAEQLEGVFRALGIIPPTVNLETELQKFTRVEGAAFYDPVAKELVARSLEPTPYLRSVLVRELTRALDDQWFGIRRPALDAAPESREGLKALVDGDARRARDRFVASLSSDERSQAEAEAQRVADQLPKDIDPAVLLRFTYPATLGAKLVDALYSAGGRARLDSALTRPPTTSEQIFFPERYLAGEEAVAVAEPASDGTVESRGRLGHIGLLLMLKQAIDPDTAGRAAQGWGGDSYTSWRQGDLTCVRATVVADTAQDTTELADALGKWAAARPGAEVSGSGPFTIKRCA